MHQSETDKIWRDLWSLRAHGSTWKKRVNVVPKNTPDSKFQGANMGPSWGRKDPGGPHVGQWTLLSGTFVFLMTVMEDRDGKTVKVVFFKLNSLRFFFVLRDLIQYQLVPNMRQTLNWTNADPVHLIESMFVPSQWETALLCNGRHWLGANLASALVYDTMHHQTQVLLTSVRNLAYMWWQ